MQRRFYDRKCTSEACGKTYIDCYEPTVAPIHKCTCGWITTRVWLAKSTAVLGDECDVVIRHGICWPDGSPRHYRSKSEMVRVAKEMGVENRVEHVGTKGGDRSKHTTSWLSGPPPGHDPRPFAALNADEQQQRRIEWERM